MTTLLLFDFDGVLNPIPYRRNWVGPKDAGVYSLESLDPRNWKTVELPIDETVYFKPDRDAVVTLPGYYKDRDIHIRWSTELVEKINALVAMGNAEFRWLTSWRENAPTLLAPLLGLEPSWESMEWEQKMSDYAQVFKRVAIEDMVRDGERRPIVWVDDVATRNIRYDVRGSRAHKRWGDRVLSPFEANGIDTLFLVTATEYGISREQWDQIETFVQEHADS